MERPQRYYISIPFPSEDNLDIMVRRTAYHDHHEMVLSRKGIETEVKADMKLYLLRLRDAIDKAIRMC